MERGGLRHTESGDATGGRGRSRAWLLTAVFLAAVALRVPGLWTEAWMDEILTLRLVGSLDSPLGVFTSLHSDNNHYLNSLWVWAVGSQAPAWLLRLPPFVLGVALAALSWRVTRGHGRAVAAVTGLLFTFSYPLIHYSSEARGYGYLVLLAFAAYALFRSWTVGGDWRAGAAYSVLAALAFLAHIGFATVFAAFLLWSALGVVAAGEQRVRAGARHLAVQVLPAVTLFVLYLTDIRFMEAEGGFAPVGPLESLAGAAGLVVGVAPGVGALVVAALAWTAIAAEVPRSARVDRPEAIFLVTAIGLSLSTGALPGYGYPRYYLTALLFALLFLGRAIAGLLASGKRKAAGVALLVTVCAVNLSQTLQFAAVGRGMYREAAAHMAVEGAPGPVTVAGSHDMGTVLALEYYGAERSGQPSFAYFCRLASTRGCRGVRPARSRGEAPPLFYVLASLEDRFEAPPVLEVPDLGEYAFERAFPKYGLSGVYWAVYRSADPPAPR